MTFITYAQLKERVEQRLDLEEEVFIQATEFLAYTKDGIALCESIIHKFRADDVYFEACAPLALVTGKQDYALPSNIYGNKIRKIVYTKNNNIFEIRRMTKKDRYFDMAMRDQFYQDTIYKYMILNQDPHVGPVLRFSPNTQEDTTVVSRSITLTSGSATATIASTTDIAIGMFVSGTGIPYGAKVVSFVTNTSVTLTSPAYVSSAVTATFTAPDVLIYYIREANIPSADGDYIDIPEWFQVVQQYVVVECLKKEPNNPRFKTELATLGAYIKAMEDALSNMVPDQEDLIEVDASAYWEMS